MPRAQRAARDLHAFVQQLAGGLVVAGRLLKLREGGDRPDRLRVLRAEVFAPRAHHLGEELERGLKLHLRLQQ